MSAPAWSWMGRAACRGADLSLFYGHDGERQPGREARERKAKAICQACPVRLECLGYAIARPEATGVWGGTGEEDRAQERRRYLRRLRERAAS